MHSALQTIFSTAETHVGLIICERLVNMPVQIIPPMYKMLLDELRNALSAVRLSRTFLHVSILTYGETGQTV
jgi:protein BCP1